MSTSGPGSAFNNNRWLLPVILVVVIAVIVLGALFGSRLKSAASSPTATPAPTSPPSTVIVTATPGPATPSSVTPTTGGSAAAIPATATPSSKGAATPLPGMAPPATVVGVLTGMVIHKQVDVTAIQAAVNAGKSGYQYYLNPVQVVQNTLPQYGFTQGFQIIAPAASPTPTPATGSDGRPLVVVMVKYQGATYKVSVVQPATRGPKGIWLIVTILPQS